MYELYFYRNLVKAGERCAPCGWLAASALKIGREEIAVLRELYKNGGQAELAEELCKSEPASFFCDGASADELRGMVDGLICFRMYARYFLTKYKPDAAGVRAFYDKLPALEEALLKREPRQRAVLPSQTEGVSFSWDTAGFDSGATESVCRRAEFSSLAQALMYDLMSSVESGKPPRRCAVCGEFFTGGHGAGARCGACREAYSAVPGAREAARLYSAARGRIYTRKSRGTVTAEDADRMLAQCLELRQQAIRGEIDISDFEKMLKNATSCAGAK